MTEDHQGTTALLDDAINCVSQRGSGCQLGQDLIQDRIVTCHSWQGITKAPP